MRRTLLPVLAVLSFFVGGFSVGAHAVLAASLYIDPFETSMHRADTISVAVRLDVDEEECVNTVDAVITYGGQTLQAVDVSRGRSILTLWVEEPVIDTTARTISFAGGIPNGYCGRVSGDPSLTNIVAELLFQAPGFSVGNSGDVVSEIAFAPTTRVLLNDGLGTEAALRTIPGTVNILDVSRTGVTDEWNTRIEGDTVPPEAFGVELVQNPEVFSGKYYVVFSTTDKQSGLDHFEIIEESQEEVPLFRWGAADAPWVRGESPYVLTDQSLNSVIRVKAVDKAGNEYIAVLVPDPSLQKMVWMPWILLGAAVLLGFALLGALGYVIWRRVRTRRLQHSVPENPPSTQ